MAVRALKFARGKNLHFEPHRLSVSDKISPPLHEGGALSSGPSLQSSIFPDSHSRPIKDGFPILELLKVLTSSKSSRCKNKKAKHFLTITNFNLF